MSRRLQKGVVLVEFTLSLLIFLFIFIGIIEFGRAMLAWNAAAEATRVAARVASICNILDKNLIVSKSRNLIQISGQVNYIYEVDQDGDGKNEKVNIDMSHDVAAYDEDTKWLNVNYIPANCSNENCEYVQTSLSNLHLLLRFPGWTLDIPLPAFSTTVVREGMSNQNRFYLGVSNNFCR